MLNKGKPYVIVSKCLGFDACRYNGAKLQDALVERLRGKVEFLPVCAEVEIGLGVPRHPIRIVSDKSRLRLLQSETGKDCSQEMRQFAHSFLSGISPDPDGFILKSRSPSCGIKDVKVYPSLGKVGSVSKTSGFFAAEVRQHFPSCIIEDEGRLTNLRLRRHFLTRVFISAAFRQVYESGEYRNLVDFHTQNKYLLMSYHQRELRELGKITANHQKLSFAEVSHEYKRHLDSALAAPPRCGNILNTLSHIQGYFSKYLSAAEKSYIAEISIKYKEGKIPLGIVVSIFKGHAIRFEDNYLIRQSFFTPFPEALEDLHDSAANFAACSDD